MCVPKARMAIVEAMRAHVRAKNVKEARMKREKPLYAHI